jgi:HEAT repeat protein
MRTLLKTIVLALIVTFASTALAQQTAFAQQGDQQSSSPDSPVPMPFDGDQDDQDDQDRSDDRSDADQARMLLMGYHGIPSKEIFEDNLDQPKVVLTSLALDDGGFSLRRKRALSALGYWADAGVMRTYTQILQDAQTPASLRHRVILLIAEHFPADALAHLKPYLGHKNLQYRLSAIEAIRGIPSDDALSALRDALESETNSVAKKRLEKYTRVAK